MIIYLMRHGEAEPKKSSIHDDERRLTKEGESQVMKNLQFAKENYGTKVEYIASSPLLRAKETAKIASRLFNLEAIEVRSELAPESTPYETYAYLSSLDPNSSKSTLLVTHQPLVSNLLGDLLGSESISMQPASIAKISLKTEPLSRAGTLEWLIP